MVRGDNESGGANADGAEAIGKRDAIEAGRRNFPAELAKWIKKRRRKGERNIVTREDDARSSRVLKPAVLVT